MSVNVFFVCGQYLLVDLDGIDVVCLCDLVVIEFFLWQVVVYVGVIVLQGYFYYFGLQQGVIGVLLLVEFYFFIYIWLEVCFVVFDIFLCGVLQVEQVLEIIVVGL